MSVEIFTSSGCRYCEDAKALLSSLGADVTERLLSDADEQKELLRRVPHARTLPQIFINEFHIGSFEDLTALHDRGELTEMLANSQ